MFYFVAARDRREHRLKVPRSSVYFDGNHRSSLKLPATTLSVWFYAAQRRGRRKTEIPISLAKRSRRANGGRIPNRWDITSYNAVRVDQKR